jgi:hypothetical protein
MVLFNAQHIKLQQMHFFFLYFRVIVLFSHSQLHRCSFYDANKTHKMRSSLYYSWYTTLSITAPFLGFTKFFNIFLQLIFFQYSLISWLACASAHLSLASAICLRRSSTSDFWASAWALFWASSSFILFTNEIKILSFSRPSFLNSITSKWRLLRAIVQPSSLVLFCALKALLRIKPYKEEERIEHDK